MPDEFANPINASTRICAVYGFPIKHSASPAMQNAGMAALGLNWRYIACEVAPENLRTAIEGAKAMRLVGLNLTVPHKLLAVDFVDVFDDSVKMWGAVNTIRIEGRDKNGTWLPIYQFGEAQPDKIRTQGFNTDAEAITRSLREDLGFELAGARVLLLGAGGAGRVAALKLAAENVGELFLVNRTHSKASAIAAEIRRRHLNVKIQVGYPRGEVDLCVNATSIGLSPNDPLPVDSKQFSLRQAHAVYDMIYRPAETLLLQTAKAGGSRVSNGLGMLLYQGAKALEIWTGQPAPVDLMRQALIKEVYKDSPQSTVHGPQSVGGESKAN
ncbi:MAG TPA: shikimate dehydrogenase [Verrucomicrobiae bacterium]|nr:shikimate dehydrogenase [Verrucomicrobiae bacterium]